MKRVPPSAKARGRQRKLHYRPTHPVHHLQHPFGLLAATLLMALAYKDLSLPVYVIAAQSPPAYNEGNPHMETSGYRRVPGTAAASIGALLASAHAIAWAGLGCDIQHGAFLMIMAHFGVLCAFNAINPVR